jgi:hypothetical protein
MSAATALLDEMASMGISVRVQDGDVRMRPREKVSADMVARARQCKGDLIHAVRLGQLVALDDDQLDAWAERVAICTIDGGLSEADAEEVAWREIECSEYDKKSENRLYTDGGKR